jgi:hypothetical protein
MKLSQHIRGTTEIFLISIVKRFLVQLAPSVFSSKPLPVLVAMNLDSGHKWTFPFYICTFQCTSHVESIFLRAIVVKSYFLCSGINVILAMNDESEHKCVQVHSYNDIYFLTVGVLCIGCMSGFPFSSRILACLLQCGCLMS